MLTKAQQKLVLLPPILMEQGRTEFKTKYPLILLIKIHASIYRFRKLDVYFAPNNIHFISEIIIKLEILFLVPLRSARNM